EGLDLGVRIVAERRGERLRLRRRRLAGDLDEHEPVTRPGDHAVERRLRDDDLADERLERVRPEDADHADREPLATLRRQPDAIAETESVVLREARLDDCV